MSNLTQRLITGTIFVIVLVGCIWWSYWSLFILCMAITVIGVNEFYSLAKKANADPQKVFGIACSALIVSVAFVHKGAIAGLLQYYLIPVVVSIFFAELFRKKSNPMSNIGWTFLGLIYIAIPMAMITYTFTPSCILIPEFCQNNIKPYDFRGPLMIFVLIWVSDSMAYVCGRLFGKHKLWERISPKKTWEGFLGGLVFTVATAGVFSHLAWGDRAKIETDTAWMVLGLLISVAGMLGDLVESLFKRSIDVKDSGTVLPGHGGILDRFDALFLATPIAISWWWIYERMLPPISG